MAELRAGERAGEPVWHVPAVDGPAGPEDQKRHETEARAHGNPVIEVAAMRYLGFPVPKLTGTAEHHANQRRMPFVRGPKDHEKRRLEPEVYVLLSEPSEAAWALLDRNQTAHKQVTYLIAAAYRDLRGWPITDRANTRNVAELLGYSSPTTANRAIQRGRLLWIALSAWPWWSLGDIGELHHAPPQGWADIARVADEFACWRDPAGYRARLRTGRHAAA